MAKPALKFFLAVKPSKLKGEVIAKLKLKYDCIRMFLLHNLICLLLDLNQ